VTDAIGDERLDDVRSTSDERPRIFVRLEVGQHPVGKRPRIAALRAADADAQPQEVGRAQLLRDRAEAVVARQPTPHLQLQPAEVEVALVVDDEHLARIQLEERGRSPDGTPGVVHVRLRLQQRDALVPDADLCHLARELPPP
jgi:hypothetical protein